MNILEIEKTRGELIEKLENSSSKREKTFLINDFFSLLILNNKNFIESYINEFSNQYLTALKEFDPFCIHPAETGKLISTAKAVYNLNILSSDNSEISEAIKTLEEKEKKLNDILYNKNDTVSGQKPFFPLLIAAENGSKIFGLLETISIKIDKAKAETSFIIIPREKDIEERIIEQIQNSWKAALKFSKPYLRKTSSHHKVVVHFDKMAGNYIGNSLGVALTISFIEELLMFYNSSIVVNIKDRIAFTGGMNGDGEIAPVSDEIIKKKTECIFYSDIKTFVIPKEDEKAAQSKLDELKKEYPERNLEIISVTDLADLLNRRNLVDIRKQNPVIRTAKFTKRNYVSVVLLVLLIAVFIFSGLWDFDDNPAILENEGYTIKVKNRNGKTLWKKNVGYDPTKNNADKRRIAQKLIDIDGDGENELLLGWEYRIFSHPNFGRVVCFNSEGDNVWQYQFKDTISTFRSFTTNYISSIIDTLTLGGRKILFLFSNNIPNYSSAIYKLDMLTGKRIDSANIYWNAGAIIEGILGDFNQDGKKEIVATAIHNGYERAVIFSIDIDKLNGQSPAPERYTFNNIAKAVFNQYVLMPHTDLNKLYNRYNIPFYSGLGFLSDSKEFSAMTIENTRENFGLMSYRFDKDLNYLWGDCGDSFQKLRDSLVINNYLSPPYTNTDEYFKILEDQIRYWDGEKFIKRFQSP